MVTGYAFYVREPHAKIHPLYFQREWVSRVRGGEPPQAAMDSFKKLHDIAIEHDKPYLNLIEQALGDDSKKDTQME